MGGMRLRSEFVDREVIDSNQAQFLLDKELRSLRIEINKLFIKFAVLPVFRIVGLEEDPLYSVPVQSGEVGAANGSRRGNLEHRGLTRKCLERNFVEPFAV